MSNDKNIFKSRITMTSRSGGSVRIEPEKPTPKQKSETKPEPDQGAQ